MVKAATQISNTAQPRPQEADTASVVPFPPQPSAELKELSAFQATPHFPGFRTAYTTPHGDHSRWPAPSPEFTDLRHYVLAVAAEQGLAVMKLTFDKHSGTAKTPAVMLITGTREIENGAHPIFLQISREEDRFRIFHSLQNGSARIEFRTGDQLKALVSEHEPSVLTPGESLQRFQKSVESISHEALIKTLEDLHRDGNGTQSNLKIIAARKELLGRTPDILQHCISLDPDLTLGFIDRSIRTELLRNTPALNLKQQIALRILPLFINDSVTFAQIGKKAADMLHRLDDHKKEKLLTELFRLAEKSAGVS